MRMSDWSSDVCSSDLAWSTACACTTSVRRSGAGSARRCCRCCWPPACGARACAIRFDAKEPHVLNASPDLMAMMASARAAGDGLKAHFARLSEIAVRSKSGPADLVSIADEEAERSIRRMLSAARPEYGFLGEESGTFEGSDGGHTWIVDPLDGTTNFLFGSPLWGVNVALARNGRVVAGVTSLPMLDEFYVAELGGGAWCNEQRIHVSARGRLGEAVLACGIPFAGKPHHPLFAGEQARPNEATAGNRRPGTGSVAMAG